MTLNEWNLKISSYPTNIAVKNENIDCKHAELAGSFISPPTEQSGVGVIVFFSQFVYTRSNFLYTSSNISLEKRLHDKIIRKIIGKWAE